MFCCWTTSLTPGKPWEPWSSTSTDRGARSVRTAVLLRKIGRQVLPLEPDYCGFVIPDAFVVGYGLDYNDEYRHLPYVGVLQE